MKLLFCLIAGFRGGGGGSQLEYGMIAAQHSMASWRGFNGNPKGENFLEKKIFHVFIFRFGEHFFIEINKWTKNICMAFNFIYSKNYFLYYMSLK